MEAQFLNENLRAFLNFSKYGFQNVYTIQNINIILYN